MRMRYKRYFEMEVNNMKSTMDMYKSMPGASGSGKSDRDSDNGYGNKGNSAMNESPKGKAPSMVGLAANCEMDNMIVRMGSSKGM
ncbi:hypothetical protein UFOVP1009_9 [uncultured Caudovirales phage]|uniref:Uncharacterized protein n=1 Tax=uncultured Caudovirales phage TaxID=2100421 RepID=A0A6J5Q5P7_9CAUD|nr:hypothetical protein UFOVP1009_9 [uncultured Caudovirales phage]